MAANTISARDALFRIADGIGDVKNGFIESTADPLNTTNLSFVGLTESTSNTYRRALLRIIGKGTTTVATYTYTTATRQAMTLSAALTATPVVGDLVQWCLWNADRKGRALAAANLAIDAVYPFFYQELIVDVTSATLTFASTTNAYTLPTDVAFLSRVGVQLTSSAPIQWIPPLDLWRVESEEGAHTLRFYHNGAEYLPATYSGYKICLWYEKRVPRFTSETDTTLLPVDYFSVGSEIYRRLELNRASRVDLVTANVNLPQLQAEAGRALTRLGLVKRPLPRGPAYGVVV